MFETLTKHLRSAFATLQGVKTLTEDHVVQASSLIRSALLEADVNYVVVENFIKRLQEKSKGTSLLKAVSPSQQFTALVHEELISVMGSQEAFLDIDKKSSLLPSVIMVCGLQGSGKTTTCAKLAAYLKKEGSRKVLLAACDLQRPAAIEQLQTLSASIQVPTFVSFTEKDPLKVAKLAYEKAQIEGFDVLIVDTAGRLHLDEELMQELEVMKKILSPREILFVASAMMGQDAVRVASEFNLRLQMTGTILTMLDGNARAGVAISICEVTGKPLKFEGVGEKISDFQIFNPHSMADRILGMGDVINLVKKAQENLDVEKAQELEKKFRKASFTYDDYLQQMSMIKKLGSLKGILKMLPGMQSLGDLDVSEKEFWKLGAMILSMTPKERHEKDELSVPRRKRIALGSGTHIDDVNRMVKGFKRIKDLLPALSKMKGIPDLGDLQNISKKMGLNMNWPRRK